MTRAGSNRPIATYRDFWPYYLHEHSRPQTRAIHYFGTMLSTLSVLAAVVSGNAWFVLGAFVGGYGPAWVGHFFIEHNRPATFSYPLWSIASDYRMTWRWLTGRLGEDLMLAGVACDKPTALR
ncbi:MAG TPA: DUF962 domain-containing protein [Rhizomicrobium sp.]|jgi:hypothetical protein|nr:DUF962 domain-containing protein [Rhizomicrobium sp.]